MTGTNCDLFTHNQPRSYLNHLVVPNVGLLDPEDEGPIIFQNRGTTGLTIQHHI
jgi:hypothetical protein